MPVISRLLYVFVASKHILSAVSLPVFVGYIATLIIYRRQPPFNSSFFYIALHCAVIDIAALFHAYLFVILPRYGLITAPFVIWENATHEKDCNTVVATYGVNVTTQLANAQTFGVILMSANRFTSTMAPMKHDEWWTRNRTHICLLAVWLVPLTLQLPSIVTGVDCWTATAGSMTVIRFSINGPRIQPAFLPFFQQFQFLVISIKLLTAGLIVSICYVFTFVSMYRRHRRMNTTSTSRAMRSSASWEIRITAVAVVNFITIILCIAFNVRSNIAGFQGEAQAHVLEEWLSDCIPCASTFVSPYMLLLLSQRFRSHFVRTLCFWRWRSEEQITTSGDLSVPDGQSRISFGIRKVSVDQNPVVLIGCTTL